LGIRYSTLLVALGERQGRVYEADVRESLREVPEGRAGVRVYLLGEETHIVCVGEKPLERPGGRSDVTATGYTFNRPEAADAEGALTGREPVVGSCLIAVEEAVAGEFLLNSGTSRERIRGCVPSMYPYSGRVKRLASISSPSKVRV